MLKHVYVCFMNKYSYTNQVYMHAYMKYAHVYAFIWDMYLTYKLVETLCNSAILDL